MISQLYSQLVQSWVQCVWREWQKKIIFTRYHWQLFLKQTSVYLHHMQSNNDLQALLWKYIFLWNLFNFKNIFNVFVYSAILEQQTLNDIVNLWSVSSFRYLIIIQSIVMNNFKWNIWYLILYLLLHHAPIHLCNQALSHTSTLRLISDWFTLSIWEIYTCVLRRCSITSNRSNNLRLKVVSGWLHFPMIGFTNIWYR